MRKTRLFKDMRSLCVLKSVPSTGHKRVATRGRQL